MADAIPVYQVITGSSVTGIYGSGAFLLQLIVPDLNKAVLDPASPYYVEGTRRNSAFTDAINKIRSTLQYIAPDTTPAENSFSRCSVIL